MNFFCRFVGKVFSFFPTLNLSNVLNYRNNSPNFSYQKLEKKTQQQQNQTLLIHWIKFTKFYIKKITRKKEKKTLNSCFQVVFS